MKISFINNILNSKPSLIKFALKILCTNACLFRHIYVSIPDLCQLSYFDKFITTASGTSCDIELTKMEISRTMCNLMIATT